MAGSKKLLSPLILNLSSLHVSYHKAPVICKRCSPYSSGKKPSKDTLYSHRCARHERPICIPSAMRPRERPSAFPQRCAPRERPPAFPQRCAPREHPSAFPQRCARASVPSAIHSGELPLRSALIRGSGSTWLADGCVGGQGTLV